MKIAFHDNALSLFGTTVAIYNWAYWARELLQIEPIILYNSRHSANNETVIEKFKNTFNGNVFHYDHVSQIDNILLDNACDYFFMEKGGRPDGVISTVCKNLVNAIAICSMNDVHGDVFATGSRWLSSLVDHKIPYVPYIVHLPAGEENLRKELNIPVDAFVFGRNGGFETFDIPFVKEAIKEIIDKRSDIWFVFQYTERFIDHDRVIFLPGSTDANYKVKFINTCDAMLHARTVGESFGMACGEFSIRNKPVITWFGSRERSHIDILQEKGIYYNTKEDISNILSNISHADINGKDWNAYRDYEPSKVMEKFKEVYLKN
jgi:hypothetical protein